MPNPKLDEATFTKAALDYLGRYSASEAGLRTVLLRRITRAERQGEVDRRAAEAAAEAALQKIIRAGYLRDDLFAEGKAASLRRQGSSARQIKQKLLQKGVGRAIVEEAVDSSPEAEQAAVVRYAKRRRLGPFASEKVREVKKDQHLAALMRAGFSLSIAKWLMKADYEELSSSASISSSEKPK